MGSGLVLENAHSFVVRDQNEPCDSVEHKLVRLSATRLSPSKVQHSTASPSSTTLVLLSHNPVFAASISLACR
ncbi:hypothetical protein TIFTF001_028351 [Ficus carica]|uniref:Uncharacterized protein n=1 Tax=Ficus carica TaxID=3494 RepID=A0AA88J015_FICCA|nr:hypothetical protein TIFTF001_028351 [Ficus carica]